MAKNDDIELETVAFQAHVLSGRGRIQAFSRSESSKAFLRSVGGTWFVSLDGPGSIPMLIPMMNVASIILRSDKEAQIAAREAKEEQTRAAQEEARAAAREATQADRARRIEAAEEAAAK